MRSLAFTSALLLLLLVLVASAAGTSRCPKFCQEIYRPVCGSDGVTYDNDCYLRIAACNSNWRIRKLHDGPCASG
nr:turripeptide OL11-like [Procambarus clarkii]